MTGGCRFFATSLLLGAPSVASAQAPDPVAQLLACRAQPDAAARLACYDREADAVRQRVDSGAIAVIDRPAQQRAEAADFGLPKRARKEEKAVAAAVAPPVAEALAGRIARVVERPDGFAFTLGSGALWQVNEATFQRPETGMEVVITRGAFGSFFASFDKQRPVRVRRLR